MRGEVSNPSPSPSPSPNPDPDPDPKQAASARRAALTEIARGNVSARNETRDERIEPYPYPSP